MSDPTSPSSPASGSTSPSPNSAPKLNDAPAAPTGPTIHIGEEFGTAKRNLPPAKIVLIAIAAVLVVVVFASFIKRARPQASGSMDNVTAVEIPSQTSTMVALTFTLHNTSDKALYVQSIQASMKGANKNDDATANAVSAIDFDRYFQAFPSLKNGTQPPLSPEARIEPGQSVSRTVIAVFDKSLDVFNQRKSVSVVIWPYNETVPILITK